MRTTPLDKLKRSGSTIKSPFSRLGNVQFSSWVNEILPDTLWTALIVTHIPRERALYKLNEVLKRIRKRKSDMSGRILVHSEMASFSDDLFDDLFGWMAADDDMRNALSPLLIIESLPDRMHWERILGPSSQGNSSTILPKAVAECFDHQSVSSTDCRWFRLMTLFVQDKISIPQDFVQMAGSIIAYPNEGDMKKVRPTIRALEMTTRIARKSGATPYNELFWQECWDKTDCLVDQKQSIISGFNYGALVSKSNDLGSRLAAHFANTIETTGVDARHDGSFGIVFYMLYLMLAGAGGAGVVSRSPVGRLALRTLVELFITLSFLEMKDDPTIWLQYRQYGSGQNKLSYLKRIKVGGDVSFLSKETLENYIDEDLWHEHLDIKLGAWASMDLRTMAIEAGEKDFYDRYYDALSGYVHGNWMAVRHSVFCQCLNPLHRFHRMPCPPRVFDEDALPDMLKIINMSLDKISKLYPSFKPRLRLADFIVAEAGETREPGP